MKVGITFSSFDLSQPGHVLMLKEAKKQCDYLIAGLQLDPLKDRNNENSQSRSITDRYNQLKGCKFIDEIIPYVTDQDLEDILRSFKIDILIIGEEYKNGHFTGKEYCIKKGIKISYNLRE